MGLYCFMSKTIALGVPLIRSMFAGNSNLALCTLPILVWHPMHAAVGSALVPHFSKIIQSERARLDVGATEHDADNNDDDASDSGKAAAKDDEADTAQVPADL